MSSNDGEKETYHTNIVQTPSDASTVERSRRGTFPKSYHPLAVCTYPRRYRGTRFGNMSLPPGGVIFYHTGDIRYTRFPFGIVVDLESRGLSQAEEEHSRRSSPATRTQPPDKSFFSIFLILNADERSNYRASNTGQHKRVQRYNR